MNTWRDDPQYQAQLAEARRHDHPQDWDLGRVATQAVAAYKRTCQTDETAMRAAQAIAEFWRPMSGADDFDEVDLAVARVVLAVLEDSP